MKAGVEHADAFYLGARELNMRATAPNFSPSDFGRVVDFCHDRGVRVYLTTNVLVYDDEVPRLRSLLERAKEAEFDGVIVHDLAAVRVAKDLTLPFHVSTQANVSNSLAAKFYEDLGASRLILARELSLEQIRRVKASLRSAQVEVFAHGAMCTSVSGRCYFSQVVNCTPERSANRGACTQPCRLRFWGTIRCETGDQFDYDGVRFLNSRDLCTVAHVPQLVEAGVDALKIEGRARSAHYVETVTRVYREALDAHFAGTFTKKKVGRWVTELKREYNRGFTTGFYFGKPRAEAQQHASPANLSHFRLIEIGRVEAYDSAAGRATLKLTNGWLRKGMDVIFEGRTTETYFHQRVGHLRVNGERVNATAGGTPEEPVLVELVVDEAVVPRRDSAYLFTDATYGRRRKVGRASRRSGTRASRSTGSRSRARYRLT
ncbi:MAG: peptidase U32 family protein [Promethearchaeota archaeon]